jgi:hypothetical protein
MFVKNEFRGKEFRVGQKLLNTLLEWAKSKNFSEILWELQKNLLELKNSMRKMDL